MADKMAEVRVPAVCKDKCGGPSPRPDGAANRTTTIETITVGREKPCSGGNWKCGCRPCPCNPCLCAPDDEIVPGDDKE